MEFLDRRNKTVQFSESFEDGEALHRGAGPELRGDRLQAPGFSVRAGAPERNWLKIKTHGRQEFVIAGYTRGQGRRRDASAR